MMQARNRHEPRIQLIAWFSFLTIRGSNATTLSVVLNQFLVFILINYLRTSRIHKFSLNSRNYIQRSSSESMKFVINLMAARFCNECESYKAVLFSGVSK